MVPDAGDGTATEFHFDTSTPCGFTWVADEPMQRASHAFATDGSYWLVDPLVWEPALERAAGMGRPAGVIQLLERHNRDCAELAARLDVPHIRMPTAADGLPFETIRLVNRERWREVALWWPEQSVLVVPECVGTTPMYTLGSGAAGVQPLVRFKRPHRLDRLRFVEPDHLLVGHGGAVQQNAAEALHRALDRARRDLPRMIVKMPALIAAARRGDRSI